MSLKVFQIGFNKCGTRTIHHFLHVNGIKSIHWDAGDLARRMFRNLVEGDGLVAGYEGYEAFSDMEVVGREFALEAYKLFPILAQQYPEAVFVLNTRDREEWVKSRFNHGRGQYAKRWKSVLKISDDDKLADVWRSDWDRHHDRVHEFFANRSHRFFKFDIAKDSPELFAQAIPDRAVDVSKYQTRGRTPHKAASRPEGSAFSL